MKINLLLAITIALFVGCSGSTQSNPKDGAILIEQGPNLLELRFWKRTWGGIFGAHGYVGHVTYSYSAALEGPGPTYTNPKFSDNPPDFHCVGTIVVDRANNRVKVKVDMRRVVSKAGEQVRTKPHPGNGTFDIFTIRKAAPVEMELFGKWISETNN